MALQIYKAGNKIRHYFFPKIGKCQETCSEQIVQFLNLGIVPFAGSSSSLAMADWVRSSHPLQQASAHNEVLF